MKTLAVGLAATALPLSAAARLNVGIGTYSYHNLSMDEMIVQLGALRVGEIEMSRGEFMLMNHPTEELFRSARTKLDRARAWLNDPAFIAAGGLHCQPQRTTTVKEARKL